MSKEDVKNMLEIVPVTEFKVEALQVKYPIIDWEIHYEGSRSYWKILRVGGITEAYQSFEDMLKGFDREDLDALWRLVKEKFNTAVSTVDKEKALWKLHSNCRVHQVSSTTRRHAMFMLSEKDYPLSNEVMTLMLNTNGMIKVLPLKTAKEVVARETERKARTTLLMALPEYHLAKFHKMADAKEMWEAIKSKFGGNDKSKKMQKYLLKQQFEGFSVSASEGLHNGCKPPSSWSQVALIMRTKPGLDTLSFNDLYNNLRVFKRDVKGTTASSSSNTQNVAFVFTDNTSSTNDVSTAYSVSLPSVLKSHKEGSSSYTDEVIHYFFANQSSAPQLDYDDLEQMNDDDDDMEEMGLKWHFARDCRAKGNHDSRRKDVGYNGNKARDNVPPPMTRNYMPSGPDVEIDYSKFTYGPKQTLDSNDDSVSNVQEDIEKSSFAFTDSVKHVKSSMENVKETDTPNHGPKVKKQGRNGHTRKGLGYAFTRKACFICGNEDTAVKASGGCTWRNQRKSWNKVFNYNSESKIRKSVKDPLGRLKYMTGNKAHLADYQEFKGGSVAFGGTNERITIKGKIKADSAGTQANDAQSANSEEIDLHEEHFVLSIWSAYSNIVKSSGDKIEKTTDAKPYEKPVSQVEQIFLKELKKLKRQEKEANVAARKETTHENQDANTNNTNLLNAVSTPISITGPSRALNNGEPSYLDDPLMPHLEDIYASPSKGILLIHPMMMKISQALEDESWVDVMQEELLHCQIQKVWILVDLPFGKKAIGTQWVYRNKKDEKGVVVRNKVKQKEDGIFISQDMYAAKILKKFDFLSMKTASTPIETQNPLVKDEEAADVDVHFYRKVQVSRPTTRYEMFDSSRTGGSGK
nr:ribonuclease H-like domain-containing protein [Tanacetum cinerariifolium]